MIYRVGKLKFKTKGGLLRALLRNGARSAEFTSEYEVTVEWPAGVETYRCTDEGVFGMNLMFDFYPDRRVA